MKGKSEEFYHFKNFVAMVRNVFLSTIMVLQSDNATEYMNQYFFHILSWVGHWTTPFLLSYSSTGWVCWTKTLPYCHLHTCITPHCWLSSSLIGWGRSHCISPYWPFFPHHLLVEILLVLFSLLIHPPLLTLRFSVVSVFLPSNLMSPTNLRIGPNPVFL